jgi:hypothetical protein
MARGGARRGEEAVVIEQVAARDLIEILKIARNAM